MRNGVLFALGAYLLWGLFPLYWPLLEPAGAIEILAHRMLWSAVVMTIIITIIRRWRTVRALSARTWGLMGLAAIFIGVNWGVYIYAVNNGHVVDASLGYFINPLVAVALGVLTLREKLSPLQWAALGVAIVGVVITASGASGFPYIGIVLAVTFGLYGLIKRVINISADVSLFGESILLFLPALAYIIFLQADGTANFVNHGNLRIALFIAAGLVTAIPLLFFGAAARQLPLSILGLLQYVNPLTQFLLGVLWAGEHMSPERWIGFIVIWGALVLLSIDMAGRSRSRRRAG